jgi:hypothetical protein
MTPGPTRILKTPLFGTLVKIATICSGNTFGARYWTDGKREAPMLPDVPRLRRQPETGELFWTDECDEVTEDSEWEDSEIYRDVPYAEPPSVDDYRRALDSGLAYTPEKQRYVLMRFWWAANDPIRHGEASTLLPPDFHERLTQLRALLDTSDSNERLMSAEAARQLGDLATAKELMNFQFPEGYSHALAVITELIGKGDSALHEITA